MKSTMGCMVGFEEGDADGKVGWDGRIAGTVNFPYSPAFFQTTTPSLFFTSSLTSSVCYGLHPVVKSELFLRSEKGSEESQFVGTRLWFLLQEPSPPLHSFMGLEEAEAVFSPLWPGMAGAQAGAGDSYCMNGQEHELTLTLWQKDGFCAFQVLSDLWLGHARMPPA